MAYTPTSVGYLPPSGVDGADSSLNLDILYSSFGTALNVSYQNLNAAIGSANADPSNPVNVLNAQTAVSQFTLTVTMISQMITAFKTATSEMIQNIR
jgi:Type III secretion needle MxiH, YscF, SsaG, EprI, PscF, EscF